MKARSFVATAGGTTTGSPSAIPATGSNSEQIQLDPKAIAELAYSYWEGRGGEGGSAEEDWVRAENELKGLG